jgi:hypothetical protein
MRGIGVHRLAAQGSKCKAYSPPPQPNNRVQLLVRRSAIEDIESRFIVCKPSWNELRKMHIIGLSCNVHASPMTIESRTIETIRSRCDVQRLPQKI